MTDQYQESALARYQRLRENESLVFAVIGQDVKDLHKSGKKFAGSCPFHAGDNPNGFILSDRPGYWRWHCLTGNCGGGSVLDYVMKRESLDTLRDAADWLESFDGTPTYAPLPKRERTPPPSPETLAKAAWQFAETVDAPAPALGMTPRAYWRTQGMTDPIIDRFWLGFCPDFRFRSKDKSYIGATVTMPIWDRGQVVNIRHRIIDPPDPGDKYRPHTGGLGLTLVNADALDAMAEGDDVLVVEGEKKAYFLLGLELGQGLTIVSMTGGMRSWIAENDDRQVYGDLWTPRFWRAGRVIFLFDYGLAARQYAFKTARRFFGRRGYCMFLEDKVDDLIIARPDYGLGRFFDAYAQAQPAR